MSKLLLSPPGESPFSQKNFTWVSSKNAQNANKLAFDSILFEPEHAQGRLRSVFTYDQWLRCALSRKLRTQRFFMRTANGRIPRLISPGRSEASLSKQIILLVLSCCGSFKFLSFLRFKMMQSVV